MHAPGLFDLTDHLDRLSSTGDPLEALEHHVDFETFRPVLTEALGYGERPKGGRPPYDPVFGPLTRTSGVRGLTVQGAGFGLDA